MRLWTLLYSMTDYRVYKDSDTGLYVAEHPDLPISSCGDTEAEAIRNAHESVELYEEPDGEGLPDYDMSQLMDRVTDAEDIQEMIESEEETEIEVVKSDTVEGDEDIDIYYPDVNLRMERLTHKSVYIAGYSGGDENNIDYRYWFNCTDSGLEIEREIVRDEWLTE